MLKFFLPLNIFLINSAYALDETMTENEDLKTALSQTNDSIGYFSLIFGLLVVIGLIYLTGFLYQKLLKVKLTDNKEEIEKPEIISTTSLGQGRNLHILKVDNKYLLVGSTPQNINLIKELDSISKKENGD